MTSLLDPTAGARRSFLLLQGPVGPFFTMLARRLRGQGHGVHRILFNLGDRLFWRGGDAVSYRGGMQEWPEFLEQHFRRWGITDVVLFGDCRPLHRAAHALASRHGIAVHVLEEGYLRPNWLTLEPQGVNRHSTLPRQPEWYRQQARDLPAWHPGRPVFNSLPLRVVLYVFYYAALLAGSRLYPRYQTHRPSDPLEECLAAIRHFATRPLHRWRNAWVEWRLLRSRRPYYLLPLQLEADSQIRFHWPAGSLVPAIEQVVASFARHAPPDAMLVVTEHPLDTGIVDLGRTTRAAAIAAGVAERVRFLRGGSSEDLVEGCRGLVTVNSTIGFLALALNVPVKTLGWALYDMPGLTSRESLDGFWRRPEQPDATLFDAFRRVVAARTQVNGGLYGLGALRLAAATVTARLCEAAEAPALPVKAVA